jgi:putative lipase involved disintegration of autophagic bodies
MRDLRIIVIESRLAATLGVSDGVRIKNAQERATVAAKGLSKRASLLAAHLGEATDPTFVASCRAWIEACDALGWKVEVDPAHAASLIGAHAEVTQ